MNKKEKVEHEFQYHKATFEKLGLLRSQFSLKSPFKKGKHQVITIFEGEFEREADMFFEFATFDYDLMPNAEARILYKFKYNPYYQEEYVSKDTDTSKLYYVPVEELEVVAVNNKINSQFMPKKTKAPISTKRRTSVKKKEVFNEDDFESSLPDPDKDSPFDQMTMRDYACIQMQTPQSFKPWLNELIKNK